MWLNAPTGWTEEDHNKFMEETQYLQDELDSKEIDPRMPYSKQEGVVKQCLKDAFWDYIKDIAITNAFFFELDFFMRQMKALQDYKWEKEGEKYDEVFDGAISGWNAIKGVIIDYGMEARKKMKADLVKEGKSEDEIKKIMKWRSDKFLSLLRERIKYESR